MQFLMAWIRKFWGVRQSTGQPYAPTSVPVGPPTYPRLYPLRLSERRMMDAAAWVNLTDAGVLQLSAGNASNDGHVDTFTIGRAATDANSSPGTAAQIEVRINDQVAYRGSSEQITAIAIQGSTDADVVNFDLPASDGSTSWTNVQYVFQGSATDVSLSAAGGAASNLQIQMVDVESIHDALTSQSRRFVWSGDAQQAQLSSGQQPGQLSLVAGENLQVDFKSPTESLDFARQSSAGSFAFQVSGFDRGYTGSWGIALGADSHLRFTDSIEFHGSSATFHAGEIEVAGSLQADHAVVQMTADSQLTIATGASVINRGGTVHLFGDTIELQDHSLVDVSSESGGGEAWIGGSPLGQSPHVPHAKVTSMAATAAIRADGGQFGNGGNIVVWADERAIVLGSGNISARGGTVSGNGGHIETSARGQVITDAAPNASATNGTAGEWLLDPFNITVTSSGTSSLTNNALSASALGTTITAATIKAALEAGNNVTLRTTNIAGAENGDIIIDQAISVDLSNRTVTLNLIAVGGVRINQAISATNGRLLIQIDAQQDVVVNASVTTNGGSFSSQGRAFTNTASIDTGVGGLTVDHVDDISINGSLDAGPIDLSSSAGDIVSNAAGAMDSHGFNAHFQSNRITLGAAVNSTGGTSSTIVTFDARTTGTSIGLGDGAAGTLALTTATLNRVQSNFGQIVVGSSNQTGRVEIGSNASPLTIANTGLRVTMSSNVNSILDLNNNLTLSQSGKVLQFLGTGSRLNVSKDLTVATTSGAITIAGNATLAGGATLTVTSNTAANNGANITISGSFSGDNTANTIEGLVVSGGTGNVTLGANASSTIGTIGVPFNDVSISSARTSL